MFAIFLTQLGKASIVDNYYDQIKALCQQMETVSLLLTCIKWYSVLMIQLQWLLTPIHFVPVTHFDPAVHKIDQEAKIYLQQTSFDIQDMIPVDVIGDGNCLYNSTVCLSGSTVLTPSELRGKFR